MPEEKDGHQAFRRFLERQAETEAANIVSNWFFERPNLFDPNARKRPKREVVMALAYIAFMAAVCAAFNLP